MTQPEQPKKNALEGSRLPVRRELYEDAESLDNVPVAKLGKEVIIQNPRPRPLSPVYSDISLEMTEKFSASLAGEMSSPEEAVAALQKEMSGLVEQGQEAAS